MYDVIVIGAGPAGCMAAKRTAAAGYKVLLIEKLEMPREKSCSGILIPKSVEIVENEFGKIPDSVLCRPNVSRGIIITNEENQAFTFESSGLNIWRSLFDHWLALAAKDSGAEIRTSTVAISCEEGSDHVSVELQGRKTYYEQAAVVIVCDGAGSLIKKNLLQERNSYIATYQTFSKGSIDLDSQFFHAYLSPELSEYDAWFNVKDDFLIIGVGVKDPNKIKHYHSRFLSFLQSYYNARIQPQVKEERWIIPYITPGHSVTLGKGRVLFAGEAANFLNPMGEGISSALVSGCKVAEAIQSVYTKGHIVNAQQLIKTYEKYVLQERQYMIRQWELLARVSPKFSDFLSS
ncbi:MULTISPECIES: NAD(P)/FAD-dependent oxidoreductase [Pelosinus]|uniref:Monooxygenase FAD-binding protein n=1 Tax=Pelosinus fermentans B4 TaxID=1149862 RepID=I9B2U3_9FIRM|nr:MULTISPECIES: NAD(P)/FAD-dependent oxidoreductase [Pelosinus]EIW19447.1 monooxygenase FAD-binding protein [Pelosinus fermentans B4]EIW24804.1 HI0933 family protein [Pelosinus fermentans A11]OAM96088.1 monooxygenase FAD-binding protein [Pelosinus fermentans DSM 17108]SDR36234.1 geranylgeranyl reductase family [Pelosinus fermentans]